MFRYAPTIAPTPIVGSANYNLSTGDVLLASGKIGSTGGGFIGSLDIGVKGRDSVHLAYDVVFQDDFEWIKGGKLPGLSGGRTDFGPNLKPDGANGFSIRPLFGPAGPAVYVYDMAAEIYGRIFPGKIPAETGRHRIELQTVLNTPGFADGIARLWVDGDLVVRADGLKFRTSTALTLDKCFFCLFYGGGDASYAPTRDHIVRVERMIAAEGYIG
jgi:hypothetical protein